MLYYVVPLRSIGGAQFIWHLALAKRKKSVFTLLSVIICITRLGFQKCYLKVCTVERRLSERLLSEHDFNKSLEPNINGLEALERQMCLEKINASKKQLTRAVFI